MKYSDRENRLRWGSPAHHSPYHRSRLDLDRPIFSDALGELFGRGGEERADFKLDNGKPGLVGFHFEAGGVGPSRELAELVLSCGLGRIDSVRILDGAEFVGAVRFDHDGIFGKDEGRRNRTSRT